MASAISYFAKFWHKVDESVKHRRRRELLTLERKRQRCPECVCGQRQKVHIAGQPLDVYMEMNGFSRNGTL